MIYKSLAEPGAVAHFWDRLAALTGVTLNSPPPEDTPYDGNDICKYDRDHKCNDKQFSACLDVSRSPADRR